MGLRQDQSRGQGSPTPLGAEKGAKMDNKLRLERARAARGKGAKPNNSELVSRRRIIGEYSTRKTAIVNHCRECCGWEGSDCSLAAEIRQCQGPECHLYPWRTGVLTGDYERGVN